MRLALVVAAAHALNDMYASFVPPLLPRIMDSVITGIEGKQFEDLSNLVFLNDVIVRRSNSVLKPYGVVVKSLNLKDLSRFAAPAK